MSNYYSQKLSAERLHKCYQIAPERIKLLLKEEITAVVSKINQNDCVCDLGCGYGRVFDVLQSKTHQIYGIDISIKNLKFTQKICLTGMFYNLFLMNAVDLGFKSDTFDVVFCIQNGISAFREDPDRLISEAVRIAKPGGTVLFSSYSNKIWRDRLQWFEIQSSHSLLGEIDYNQTKEGVIVCKDGFKAVTFSASDFMALTIKYGNKVSIYEVDNSSIFCEIKK